MHRQQWVLPGGYLDPTGRCHRDFELRPLTGREEELLLNGGTNTAKQVTTLLSHCVTRLGALDKVTPDTAGALLIADRQYLLLMLRHLTFGDQVQATIRCPWQGCNQSLDIDFLISDIPVTPGRVEARYELAVSAEDVPDWDALPERFREEPRITFRLPDGADQQAVAEQAVDNDAEAATVLLARCIQRFGAAEGVDEATVRELPAALRQKIEEHMEAHAPDVALAMDMDCPECGRGFTAPFDLQDFFFGEIRAGGELLLREVHYLAFHYHWSEAEIMDMTRTRRRQYINVLAEEIERLNEAVQ